MLVGGLCEFCRGGCVSGSLADEWIGRDALKLARHGRGGRDRGLRPQVGSRWVVLRLVVGDAFASGRTVWGKVCGPLDGKMQDTILDMWSG